LMVTGPLTFWSNGSVLLPGTLSPPPETVKVVVTRDGAFNATFSRISISGAPLKFGGTESERVQVRVLSVQFQPGPLMEATERPVVVAIVTVMGPLDATLPAFSSPKMRSLFVSPTERLPAAKSVKRRSVTATAIEVKSLAVLLALFVSPPPATLA